MVPDSYLTIAEPGHAQTRVLGSRFLGGAVGVDDLEKLDELLAEHRRIYYDATHHCYAARLGFGSQLVERSADAGEPRGTAGTPILQEIRSRDLVNCAVIVTRYFGGTKLGKGGLVRAYGECAAAALSAARIEVRLLHRTLQVRCSFDIQNLVYTAAQRFGASVRAGSVEEGKVTLLMDVVPSRISELAKWLTESGQGKLDISEVAP